MTISIIVSCPYSIAAMIPTFLLFGYHMVRMKLEENGVNPETYRMLGWIEKIELHRMSCGANYNQKSCATCGNMATRLS